MIKSHVEFSRILLLLFVAFFCSLVLGALMHPFLRDQALLGWDLYPHYYVAEVFYRNFMSGRLTSYDPNWLGGYPAFVYYGPFAYFCIELVRLISFNSKSIIGSFNVLIFCLPFFYLVCLCWLVRIYANSSATIFALIFGLISLTLPSNHLFGPVGIFGSIYHGHLAAFLATLLLMVLLGLWELLRQQFSLKQLILIALVWAALILTHPMTAIFSLFVGTIHSAVHGRTHTINMLKCLVLALIVSSFWWFPMALHLSYSAGERQGMGTTDPLLLLFPDLVALQACFRGPSAGRLTGFLLCSVSFAACTVVGIVTQFKLRRPFLPFVFILTLLLVVRNILPNVITIGIHYNRFVLPLVPIVALIAAIGAERLLTIIRLSRSALLRTASHFIFVLISTWILFATSIQDYGPALAARAPQWFNSWISRSCDRRTSQAVPRAESVALEGTGILELGEYLASINRAGRVAVETGRPQNELGSPHLLSTILPLRYGVPVLNGLLAESSTGSGFIIPTMGYLTGSLLWGRNKLAEYYGTRPRVDSVIRRLGLFNVEYLVASGYSSSNVNANLFNSDVLELTQNFGRLSLFRLKQFQPFIEGVSGKPFLFVSHGGMNFREYSEFWFQGDELLDYPVLHTQKQFENLNAADQERIGGVVLSYPDGEDVPDEVIQIWLGRKKRVAVLDGTVSSAMLASDSVYPVSSKYFNAFTSAMYSALALEPLQKEAVPAIKERGSKVHFVHEGGAIINYNFHPRWNSTDQNQTIFEVTPSHIFVFATGETVLDFD